MLWTPSEGMNVIERNHYPEYFAKHDKIRSYDAHQAKIHSVGWNCDGRRLASGSFDKTINIYSLDRTHLKTAATLRGHSHQVDQLIWNPSHPDLLASAGGDKTVRIWDARSKKQIAVIPTKGENINIAWSPDGSAIAVGNKDDLVQFIDARTHKIIANEQFKVETNEIAWNNSGSHFFLTNGSGQVLILSWPDLKTVLTLQAHPSNIICIRFDPTGKYFAVGATDALVSIWDVENLVCLRTVDRLDWPVRSVSFSYDGKLLASGSEDLCIDVALVDTVTSLAEKVCEVRCDDPTYTVAWHPKEYLLAFACDDKGSIKLFGVPSASQD